MSRKQRGYDSQRIVADFLKANGWPYAEPVGAGRPGSDVTGVVGVDIEVRSQPKPAMKLWHITGMPTRPMFSTSSQKRSIH